MRRTMKRLGGVLKRVAIAGVSAALALSMAVSGPVAAVATGDGSSERWDISKSKTATDLDENYQSKVTLSLPSAEEELVSDVVFVLDKSTSPNLEDQAIAMLESLKNQVAATGATVKVGVVIFNKNANSVLGLTELTDANMSAIETAIKTEISSGTNTHAGLLAGKAMLDGDASVAASRKYLVFVSDGITYMYNSKPTVTAWSFNQPNSKDDWYGSGSFGTFAGPDNWYSKYHTNDAPNEGWDNWLKTIGEQVTAQGTTYEYPYGGTITKATPEDSDNWDKNYAMSIDKALYLTYQAYQSAVSEGYHCYAMVANTGSGEQYTWGPSFMSFLAGDNKNVSFESIQNDIYYLVDSGSTVVDVIGNDFDFVDDLSAITMTVNGVEVDEIELTPTDGSTNATSVYGFADTDNGYSYVLDYYKDGVEYGGATYGECFIWSTNVPITNFDRVQITYTVELTNPSTVPGTHEALTNESATLFPVDSNGEVGDPEDFEKPEVSYTVAEPESEPAPEEPTPVTIGGDSFGAKKVLENGTLKGGEYQFELYQVTGEEEQLVSTASNDAEGNIVFDDLTYTEPGTYEYVIREVLPTDDDAQTAGVQKDGVTYDQTSHGVKVTVSEQDGKLVVADGAVLVPEGGVTFTNVAAVEEPPVVDDKPAIETPAVDDKPAAEDPKPAIPQTGDAGFAVTGVALGGAAVTALGVALKRRNR